MVPLVVLKSLFTFENLVLSVILGEFYWCVSKFLFALSYPSCF